MVKLKKKLKPKFWMFQGQYDLEDQSQGHQFSNSSETLMRSIHGSSLKIKFKTTQNISRSKGITQTTQMKEPKIIMSAPGWGGHNYIRPIYNLIF